MPEHLTCFVNGTLLFPLALGTGAREKRNEHAQTRSFITSAQQASDTAAPEKATDVATARRVEARGFMVAAANPLAAEAGRDVIAAAFSPQTIYPFVSLPYVISLF